MVGGNTTVVFNGLYNYTMHVMILSNIATGEPDTKIINENDQDKDNFIFNNILYDSKWNQINDTIK